MLLPKNFNFVGFFFIFVSENVSLCVFQCLSILSVATSLPSSHVLLLFHWWLDNVMNFSFYLYYFCHQTYMNPMTSISLICWLIVFIWLNISKTSVCIWESVHAYTSAYMLGWTYTQVLVFVELRGLPKVFFLECEAPSFMKQCLIGL